jgi:tRNA threonylcarbamoyladenosine biosynthesis protein TsaE
MSAGATFSIDLADEAQTRALAAAVAVIARPGMEIHLSGDLAAGKTAFARGFLQALGHHGAVKSPTFTLVESYDLAPGGQPLAVHHFDLYRLTDPEELHYLGFEDYRRPDAIALIEWPSRGAGLLLPSIAVELTITGLESRRARVELGAADASASAAEFRNLVMQIK